MKSSIRSVFQEFAETTTAHAPPKILTHTHVVSKLFWGLLFFTGLGTFIFFSQDLITTYLEYGKTTDIELKFSVLQFPAVTICNQNQFRNDRIPKDLQLLLDDFLLAKREDMFGGKDKFDSFQAQGAAYHYPSEGTAQTNADPVTNSAASKSDMDAYWTTNKQATVAAGNGAGTTANNNNQQSGTAPPAPQSRKRRAVFEEMDEQQLTIMDDLIGFYTYPDITDDMANMTWFDNVGETSSEKTILLNLTQYISSYEKEELMKYGHDIQEMLQECVFMGKTCGPSHFYHFYDMKYGNCYTFNSGMEGYVSKITNPGTSFGLSMTLYVNQDAYIPVLTQEAGIRVMLHRQGQVPIMEEDGFDISPGSKSGIAVKYVEIDRLEKYTDCTTDMNRTNLHEYYPGNYTQKACLKTCLQNGIIEACGCANPLYRHASGVLICGPDDNACVEDTEYRLLDNDTCSQQCPTPCWESQYQYVVSTSQWPSNSYMPYLKESLDERGDSMKKLMESDTRTGLSEHFLKMSVYYDNLNYYKYTERLSMTGIDLIGALGGHLGLWIGMSLVSFVEVFELLLSTFKWCAYQAKRNKTSSLTDLGREEKEKVPDGCSTPVLSIKDNWLK